MRSMTGYGHGQTTSNGSRFTVELNSVNRKQSDVVVTLPRELMELEPRVRDTINTEISRGRLTVVIALHAGAASVPRPELDVPLARAYFHAMQALRDELGASGDISIDTILRAPGVLRMTENQVSSDDAWPAVEAALKEALAELVSMREREGKHLAKDLIKRLKVVREAVRAVRELQPNVMKKYRQSLHERVQRTGIEISMDDERLIKEVIFFAEKSDITEEVTRLESHFAQFAHHLRRQEPVGRTMEFLCQEVGRELNTVGSKANDVEISQLIVTCKSEMEKIREQIQNIE
jgi:uncharacterized protein (TIGR00255 family)